MRDVLSSIGFARLFETLAEIGFKYVEFAGYTQGTTPEITPAQLNNLLNQYGLRAIGSHVSPSDDASMKQILDDAQTIGIPQVGISFEVPNGTTTSGWQVLADQLNHYGQLAAQRGIGFYLHNHFQEWAQCPDNPTKRGEDILLAECDPRYVFFEMDIYWAYVGQWQTSPTHSMTSATSARGTSTSRRSFPRSSLRARTRRPATTTFGSATTPAAIRAVRSQPR